MHPRSVVGIGTSILVGATGAFVRLEVSAQAFGFKMHAIGVLLMIAGVVGLVASVAGASRAAPGAVVLAQRNLGPSDVANLDTLAS